MVNNNTYTGNAVPSPGIKNLGSVLDPELLYSANNYDQRGVTLKGGQGILPLGTFLKQDATTKHYVKATAADAEGVLRQTVDTDAEGTTWQANILYSGFLKLDHVKAANSGATLAGGALGATVNESAGFFKF